VSKLATQVDYEKIFHSNLAKVTTMCDLHGCGSLNKAPYFIESRNWTKRNPEHAKNSYGKTHIWKIFLEIRPKLYIFSEISTTL
jgi:hypothetical protein